MIHPLLPKVSTQFYSMKDLEKENAELRQQLADFESKKDHWSSLFEENSELRSYTELPKRTDYKTIVAQVSSRSPLTGKSRFIINKGKESDLKVGLPVMVRDCLIGRLMDVQEGYSVVVTIVEESMPVYCRLKGTEFFGKLSGEMPSDSSDELLCKLKWLYRDVKIVPGMLVETSGFTSERTAIKSGAGLIPGALKIGKLKSVSKNEKYQEAAVIISADWKSFDYVSILIKEEE